MAYLALYRKYRPKTFDEVIGQEHIVKALTNQIKNNNISHAYLFCGTRGTGKTSCAKIFAKSINCMNSINGSPCLQCEVCKESENNLDIIEIDAASNNRVDEIRDLREKVNYYPTVGKYKVYIIDEVHMLTDSAFNALLKTLEEPPKHAVFILCTTEVHKLPATILSRCTRFDFKLVSNEELEKHLENIFTKSNIKFDKESLSVIAKAGQGSVRDTLSAAEMCTAFCDNNITYNSVINCLGLTNNDTLYQLAEAIITKNASNLLNKINNLTKNGYNLMVVLKDLNNYLNNMLIAKLINDSYSQIGLPQEDYDKLVALSKNVSETSLLKYLEKFASIENTLKISLNPNMLVEVTMLGLIVENNEIEELKERVENLEKKTINENVKVEKQNLNTVSFSENKQEEKTYNPKQIFGEMVNFIKNENLFMLYAVCAYVKELKVEENKFIVVCTKNEYDIFKENYNLLNKFLNEKYSKLTLKLLCNEQQVECLEENLKEKFGEKLTIKD